MGKKMTWTRADKLLRKFSWYYAIFILILFIVPTIINTIPISIRKTEIIVTYLKSQRKDAVDYNFQKPVLTAPAIRTASVTNLQMQSRENTIKSNTKKIEKVHLKTKIKEQKKSVEENYLTETEEIIKTAMEGYEPETWADPLNLFVDYPVNSYSHNSVTENSSTPCEDKPAVNSIITVEIQKGVILR